MLTDKTHRDLIERLAPLSPGLPVVDCRGAVELAGTPCPGLFEWRCLGCGEIVWSSMRPVMLGPRELLRPYCLMIQSPGGLAMTYCHPDYEGCLREHDLQ